MERMTKRGHKFNLTNVMEGLNGYIEVDEILNRLAAYEETGLEPEEIVMNIEYSRGMYEEYKELQAENAQLKEQLERAVVLPCRCENCLYGRLSNDAFDWNGKTPLIECDYMTGPNRPCEFCSWGKPREEAEKALKEGKG